MKRIVPLLALPLVLTGCAGPRPVVVSQSLQAPLRPDGPFKVTVTVRNEGSGDGQAELTVRLRSPVTGQTVAQETRDLDLKAHETLTELVELKPPQFGEYEPVVDVAYPPE